MALPRAMHGGEGRARADARAEARASAAGIERGVGLMRIGLGLRLERRLELRGLGNGYVCHVFLHVSI